MDRLQLSLLPFLGRVMMAYIFVMSGFGKLMDPAGTAAYIASKGLPMPQVGVYAAAAVELLGGIALILGFQARIVALILAVFTLVAAFAFHMNADMESTINFLKNVAIAGGFLQIVAFGPGGWSLDAMFGRRRI